MQNEGTQTSERTRRVPVAALLASALGILIALGAALGASLSFTGPRWFPGFTSTPRPVVQTNAPSALPTATPPAAPGTRSGLDLTWVVIVLAVLALAAIAFFGVRWLIKRLRDRQQGVAAPLGDIPELFDSPDDPSVETSLPYLRRGLRRALAALDEDRSPRDAIIEAWLGLQEAAEDAGFRRGESETPTEFTSRILERVEVDPLALATLRRLYLAVRFGDAVGTPDDVRSARSSLETLQAQWESASDSTAPSPAPDGEAAS